MAGRWFGAVVTTWIGIAVTSVGVLLIPLLIYLIKGANRWGRTEQKLENLIEGVRKLVEDKDKIHHEILETMRNDREATDRRLRFMEEYWMKKGLE